MYFPFKMNCIYLPWPWIITVLNVHRGFLRVSSSAACGPTHNDWFNVRLVLSSWKVIWSSPNNQLFMFMTLIRIRFVFFTNVCKKLGNLLSCHVPCLRWLSAWNDRLKNLSLSLGKHFWLHLVELLINGLKITSSIRLILKSIKIHCHRCNVLGCGSTRK